MECQIVNRQEASKILGMGVPEIYMRMRTGELPIGRVLRPKAGHKNYRYRIYRSMLMEYVGLNK